MILRSWFLAALLLPVAAIPTLAQDAPRQLNTLPTAPVAPPDTARPAAQTQPQPAPAPVYQPAPAQSRYRLGLKSGDVYAADDVTLRQPVIGRPYLLVNGRQRFELDQIKFYEDETGHYVRTTLPGTRREATLRREKTGRISTYSITTQQYAPGAFGSPFGYGYGGFGYGGFGSPYGYGGGYPYNGYRTVKTEYFSKDGGPIENLSFRSLNTALSDNAGSREILGDVARIRRFSTAGYIVGGGLLAAGLYSTFYTNRGISPMLYLSLPVLLVPTFLGGSENRKLRQAIAIYNHESMQ